MAIDINEPVEQGHDMVINHPDGSQTLGTAEEKAKTEGVRGAHTDAVPQHTDALVQKENVKAKAAKKTEEAPVTYPVESQTPVEKASKK